MIHAHMPTGNVLQNLCMLPPLHVPAWTSLHCRCRCNCCVYKQGYQIYLFISSLIIAWISLDYRHQAPYCGYNRSHIASYSSHGSPLTTGIKLPTEDAYIAQQISHCFIFIAWVPLDHRHWPPCCGCQRSHHSKHAVLHHGPHEDAGGDWNLVFTPAS